MDRKTEDEEDYLKFTRFLKNLVEFYSKFSHLLINSLNDVFLEEIFCYLKDDKLILDTIELLKLSDFNIENIISHQFLTNNLTKEQTESNIYYSMTCTYEELITSKLIKKFDAKKSAEKPKNNYKIKKKKSYEVENLSHFMIKKLEKNDIKSILELGCGKSYLTNNILIKNEDIIYVGIDKKEELIKQPLIKKNKNIILMNYFIEHYNFKKFYEENLKDYIRTDNKNLLFGLHSCGNLTSDCLKIYKENDCFSHLIIVGCCLNLLKEYVNKNAVNSNLFNLYFKNIGFDKKNKFLEETLIYEDDYNQIGFPLSKEIKTQYSDNFFLGRTVRNAAMQSPPKPQDIHITISNNDNYKKLLFRAILQAFLDKYLPQLKHYYGFGKVVLGKSNGDILSDFNNYLLSMLNILKDNFTKNALLFKNSEDILFLLDRERINSIINSEEYSLFFDRVLKLQNYLWALYVLRMKFARIIELIVAVDRIVFLYESGINKNKLIEIFDQSVSVRNFLI